MPSEIAARLHRPDPIRGDLVGGEGVQLRFLRFVLHARHPEFEHCAMYKH
jgi:hypothetical protein